MVGFAVDDALVAHVSVLAEAKDGPHVKHLA